jgi:hypothetical protein
VKKSNEEKFATVVSNLISDLRFDLDLAGKYLAWYLPNVAFRRFMEIAESAKAEREGKKHERDHIGE